MDDISEDGEYDWWYEELLLTAKKRASETFSKKVYVFMEIIALINKMRHNFSHIPTYYIITEAEKDFKTLKNVSIESLERILYEYKKLIVLLV